MVHSEALGGDDFRLRTQAAEVLFKRLAPHVILVQVSGDIDVELFEPVASRMTPLLGSHPLLFYSDLEHLVSYTPGIRARWTRWFMEHRGQVECFVLVKSSLVRMGMVLINLALDNLLHAFTDREEFEARLRQSVASGG